MPAFVSGVLVPVFICVGLIPTFVLEVLVPAFVLGVLVSVFDAGVLVVNHRAMMLSTSSKLAGAVRALPRWQTQPRISQSR